MMRRMTLMTSLISPMPIWFLIAATYPPTRSSDLHVDVVMKIRIRELRCSRRFMEGRLNFKSSGPPRKARHAAGCASPLQSFIVVVSCVRTHRCLMDKSESGKGRGVESDVECCRPAHGWTLPAAPSPPSRSCGAPALQLRDPLPLAAAGASRCAQRRCCSAASWTLPKALLMWLCPPARPTSSGLQRSRLSG